MKKINSKGLTLMELLAVLVILVVLALIAVPIILKIVTNSRKGVAKSSAVAYLRTIENYMVMHKVDPKSYPFQFEPDKPYSVEEINKIINMDGKLPTEGSIVVDSKNNVKEAEIKIDGYEVACESASACVVGGKPVIHVIIPDGWSKEKEIEIIVVRPGTGLDKKPFSYDGGSTWTDEKTKSINENGEIDIKVKDKHGKEVEDIFICTKKVDGKGDNCYRYDPNGSDTKGGSGKGDSTGNGSNNSGKIVISGVDNVAPTCELEITGTKGEDGYYRSDIEARISKTEDIHELKKGVFTEGSGVKSTSINFEKVTTDGSYKITGTVIDNVGNVGECSKVVTRDTKKPTITLIEEGTTRSDGYESGATVKVKCSDETGKISYQTPDVILNGGGTKTVTATCKDNAGNEVSASKTYNVYEYSANATCGYNSCANSACGTATGTRSTGETYACGSYECGTRSCSYTISDTCESCTTTPKSCTTEQVCESYGARYCCASTPVYGAECKGYCRPCESWGTKEKCTGGGTTCSTYSCSKTVHDTCPKYCTEYCNKTESYTYNKTCTTAACGNQTCWHK